MTIALYEMMKVKKHLKIPACMIRIRIELRDCEHEKMHGWRMDKSKRSLTVVTVNSILMSWTTDVVDPSVLLTNDEVTAVELRMTYRIDPGSTPN